MLSRREDDRETSLAKEIRDLPPHAHHGVKARIGPRYIGAKLDEIARFFPGCEGFANAADMRHVFGCGELGGKPADRVQDVDCRIVSGGGKTARENDVAVEDGSGRIANGLIEVVAFDKHGKRSPLYRQPSRKLPARSSTFGRRL